MEQSTVEQINERLERLRKLGQDGRRIQSDKDVLARVERERDRLLGKLKMHAQMGAREVQLLTAEVGASSNSQGQYGGCSKRSNYRPQAVEDSESSS